MNLLTFNGPASSSPTTTKNSQNHYSSKLKKTCTTRVAVSEGLYKCVIAYNFIYVLSTTLLILPDHHNDTKNTADNNYIA